MLQYSIRAAISAISLSQWAALHLFPSVAHILFTCWCDESICFVTLSGVLCLGAVYWSAWWEVADAAVETFLFFFLFTGKKKKKKKEIHVFLIHTNVRKQKSKHESPFCGVCCCLPCWLQHFYWYVHKGKMKETAEQTEDMKWGEMVKQFPAVVSCRSTQPLKSSL